MRVEFLKAIRSDLRLVFASLGVLIFCFVGIFSDQLAGEDRWIPFGPHEIAEEAKPYTKPGSRIEMSPNYEGRSHSFGSDQLGRDVAARLVHGTSVALMVGFLSSLICLFISLVLGGLAGYYGNNAMSINVWQLIAYFLGIVTIHYYAYESSFLTNVEGLLDWSFTSYASKGLVGLISLVLLSRLLRMLPGYELPLIWDTIVIKIIEVFESVPRLFLLLAVFAIIRKPSVLSIAVLIGFIRWPSLTRIIRAETLKAKQESYVLNAKVLGMSDFGIYIKHILPNIYKPILILTAINIGTAILIESSLSFLHIGLPITEVSWGLMLTDARQYIPAWWLAIGPGSLIFISILCFNTISQRLSHHLESN